MKQRVLLLLFLLAAFPGFGQWVLVPVEKDPSNKSTRSARTQDGPPLTLPFWDDFSTIRSGYVNPLLWQFGTSVWVNDGMGINAPSMNVATFDGLDSLGKPYNVNDVLAKGFADKLISQPIQLDLVSASERLGVALTFFYEFRGNGEAPDPGDLLSLAFKNDQGTWDPIWSIENTGTLAPDKFIRVTIPITDDKYFHDAFQFRFQNFARLSGPYDTWHLDYIYISNGKSQSTPVFPLFPDRTIAIPFTSIFKKYRAMPIGHFFADPSGNLINPSITITNLRQDQVAGNGQPVSYSTTARIAMTKEGEPDVVLNPVLDVNVNIGSELTFAEQKVVTLQTLPDVASWDEAADSINIKLNILFDTGDDKIKTPTEGDYDFDVFNPITFKSNDSVSATYVLHNYYAYDDGSAEYGAGLNQPGAELAYRFDMATPTPDTIVAVDMYFPRFGDESNQIIQLKILRELSTNAFDVLYQGNIPIQRGSNNTFWRAPLPEAVVVREKFYIGWRQLSSAVIAVGLDKNTDSGDQIYSNINAAWVQNTTLKGSLMIRPIFGSGQVIINQAESKTPASIYPNPTTSSFYITGRPQHISLMDLSGREMAIRKEYEADRVRVTVSQPASGLYILRTFENSQWHSYKLVVE